MSRRILAAATLAAALATPALATPAHAYVTETTKWNPSSLPITYHVNTGTIPSGASEAAVDAGFASWAGPSCTNWRTTNGGSTTRVANTGDRQNTILWLNSWPPELGDVSSVIGVTTPVWTVGGYFNDADIQFNHDPSGFVWSSTGSGGTVDTQSIATHEEGHFLGLDHSPVRGAVMAAAYGGGLLRALSTDDQNGVCFLYPSGVAPMDAGVPPVDMGSSSDPCAAHGGTCDGCTPYAGCGWCGASSACMSGTGTSAPAGCSGSWAWYPMDCTAPTGGTGRIGDPCTSGPDCGTGLCVTTDGVSGFCTHACGDDCGCEGGYTCYVSGTLSACIPGTNTCPTAPPDMGTMTGTDMGTTTGTDMGTTTGTDMGTTTGMDGGGPLPDGSMDVDSGSGAHGRGRGGCCSVPGTSPGGAPAGFAALALVALGVVVRRRGRR